MNPRLEAAWEIHQFLAEHRLPYAIIGGIAVGNSLPDSFWFKRE